MHLKLKGKKFITARSEKNIKYKFLQPVKLIDTTGRQSVYKTVLSKNV